MRYCHRDAMLATAMTMLTDPRSARLWITLISAALPPCPVPGRIALALFALRAVPQRSLRRLLAMIARKCFFGPQRKAWRGAMASGCTRECSAPRAVSIGPSICYPILAGALAGAPSSRARNGPRSLTTTYAPSIAFRLSFWRCLRCGRHRVIVGGGPTRQSVWVMTDRTNAETLVDLIKSTALTPEAEVQSCTGCHFWRIRPVFRHGHRQPVCSA